MYSLDEWGLGGRSFGPVLTWFLITGDLYTAYTFVALPGGALRRGRGGLLRGAVRRGHAAAGVRRAEPDVVGGPRARPGDPGRLRPGPVRLAFLSLLVAVAGILGTLPYIALQLVGMEAVFRVMGLNGSWPLWTAFGVLALFTYNSGLRAPALMAILKDVLFLWVVLAVIVLVAARGGWGRVFHAAAMKFADSPSPGDGLLLSSVGQVSYATLALGSALALFLYPHAMTGVLAAKSRATIRRNVAALPVYTLVLGIIALLGYMAVADGITPLGADPAAGIPGDRNTIMPRLFDVASRLGRRHRVRRDRHRCLRTGRHHVNRRREPVHPQHLHRVPASRCQPGRADPGQPTRLIDRQVQRGRHHRLPAAAVLARPAADRRRDHPADPARRSRSVCSRPGCTGTRWWPAWWSGWAPGSCCSTRSRSSGRTGGWSGPTSVARPWPLAHLGIDGGYSVYAGLVALVLNLGVAVVATPVLRLLRVPTGGTSPGAGTTSPRRGVRRCGAWTSCSTAGRSSGPAPSTRPSTPPAAA
jgi:hypothetical protein